MAQSVEAPAVNVEEKAGEVRINVNPDVNPTYGETGGAMLLMEDVTVSRGDRDLMTEVNLRIMPKDRIGLVGPNGAGKSTLLSASCGRIPVMGRVLVKPGVSLGYLVQTAVSGSRRTCWEEAASQMHRLNAAQAALNAAFLPAMTLSGFVFEIASMPAPVRAITYIVPARYFVSALQTLFQVGTVWSVLWLQIALLLGASVFFLGLTALKTRRRLE